jgi:hypothetical protein
MGSYVECQFFQSAKNNFQSAKKQIWHKYIYV